MRTPEDKKMDNEFPIRRYTLWAFVGVLIVWGASFLLFLIPCSEERGQIGDMFGLVNSLFSGLAFAGLILTLILQRRELLLQREELEQTRKEFAEQNKTMKRQRFENTFFNLMTLQQHITDNLEYENPDGADYFEAKGREVFRKIYLEKNNFDDSYGLKGSLRLKEGNLAEVFSHYKGIEVFNHYFHSFDGILSYIDSSDLIEKGERLQYAIMLRNTLSDNERYVLFYYFASRGEYYKILAEEYTLFYDVEPSQLAKPEHIELFGTSAYTHF